jgi:hypothetical protein
VQQNQVASALPLAIGNRRERQFIISLRRLLAQADLLVDFSCSSVMMFERSVPVGDERSELSSYGFPGRAAKEALGGRIHVYDTILQIKHYHAIAHTLHNVFACHRDNVQQAKTEQA